MVYQEVVTVPGDEWLCRFIEDDDDHWNPIEAAPTPNAFKESGSVISTWSRERVQNLGDELGDLAIDRFTGAGQALMTAEDYVKAADDAKLQNPNIQTTIEVNWRPDEVRDLWLKWQEAHAQAEGSTSRLRTTYLVALVERCRETLPPKSYRS